MESYVLKVKLCFESSGTVKDNFRNIKQKESQNKIKNNVHFVKLPEREVKQSKGKKSDHEILSDLFKDL
jgi:hypothetical protein